MMHYQRDMERYLAIKQLVGSGFSYSSIGMKLGLSGSRVAQIFNEPEPVIPKCNICGETVEHFFQTRQICSSCLRDRSGREYTRNLVRIRDNYTCQGCGKQRTPTQAKQDKKRLFDVHHLNGLCGKKSRGYDRIKDLDGLITLCHKCHFNRHDWAGRKK